MTSTFWQIARRPRWIAALLLCLGIAAGFAALGQWQLSRSVDNAHVAETPDTEQTVPLNAIAGPQAPVTVPQFGRSVTATGTFTGEFTWVTDRNNGGSEQGSTLVGHFVTDGGSTLVVALGWKPGSPGDTDLGVFGDSTTITGRYLESEVPSDSDFEAGKRQAIAVPELINIWSDATPTYGGYLMLDQAPDGLDTIYSPAPEQEVSLNALNIFYAIEWAIFAGFAIYLWYRLVKDVVEKEAEERLVE